MTAIPAISVVVPVHNEADNLKPLIDEIRAALATVPTYEIVYVDDASTDATGQQLSNLMVEVAALRVLRHGACAGQSAAIATGVAHARGVLIATLDGDGQNDPADIPKLLAVMNETAAAERDRLLVTGHRVTRRDSAIRRFSSRVANAIRSRLLGDQTPDTGCGLKVFTRAAFLDMPRFDHMHRFLPALMIRQGGQVRSVPVNHRPRLSGQSKYGLFGRLWVGIVDLFGLIWLRCRAIKPDVEELEKEK
jgi:dolichol-phosphate mannosyltransferase